MRADAASPLHPKSPGLFPFVAASLVAHALVVGAVLVASWLWSAPRMQLDTKPIRASLVRKGKPRDERLLPRRDEPPPAEPPPRSEPPPPAPQPATPPASPAVAPRASGRSAPDAGRPPKATPGESRQRLLAAFERTAREGRVSHEVPEGALDGDLLGDAAQAEGERYFALLQAVVKRNYDVSSTIPEAERRQLRAELVLRLGARGELIDVQLARSSGNALFDGAILGAVRKAAPFGPPPEHLRESLHRDGVAFMFRAAE